MVPCSGATDAITSREGTPCIERITASGARPCAAAQSRQTASTASPESTSTPSRSQRIAANLT